MSARRRFAAALVTWALLFVASPGILSRDGSAAIAFVALIPWAAWCSRSGPRAFLTEWLAAAIGLSALTWWSTFVWWGTLLAVAIVPAFYVALAGVLLRRVARRFPLALAAPVAWIALETLRLGVEPPFGFGWLRLGHWFHATGWLAGSARVWGTAGVGFAVAALAGGIADVTRGFGLTRSDGQARGGSADPRARGSRSRIVSVPRIALATGPLALAAVLGLTTSAPETVPGPRVMLVQPAFEQYRKMERASAVELYRESIALTRQGLDEARRAGELVPDLVAWGETMFPAALAEPGLVEAFDRGARAVEWGRDPLERHHVEGMREVEERWVGEVLFAPAAGKRGVLPEGTSFLTGVELFAASGDQIRRRNAIVMWDADGRRAGSGGKQHLVPGAEFLCGLERLGWVRDLADAIAGYIPDLEAYERTEVLELAGRAAGRPGNGGGGAAGDGRMRWRLGLSVCFDNAYDDPYTEPLREGELDFHLVCSNEAWYEQSFEYDQMVAFSRMIAISTGRAIVRATNAGISIVIGPEGRDVARLERGGEDRMVAGTLRATVPVPRDAADRPPYVRGERAWIALWLGLGLGFGWLASRRGYRPGAAG